MDSMKHPLLYDRLGNRVAILDMAYQVKVTRRLKQEWTVEFYHPRDSANKWTLIQTECLVEVEGQKYVLKVVEPDDSKGGILIHCQGEHISTQATDEFIDPADDTTLGRTSYLLGVTAQTALQNLLLGTRFTFGTVTVTGVRTQSTADAPFGSTTITVQSVAGFNPGDVIQIGDAEATIAANGITGTTITFSPALYADQPPGTPVGKNIHDLNAQERNLMDALRELETIWNGELDFNNYTVNLVTQMGQSNGVAFRYRKQNQNIKRTEDSRSLCTRLYGYGNGGLTIESVNGGKKYLDASTINAYSRPIKLKKDYSQLGDPESLYQAMLYDLNLLSQPKVTYQLSIIELAKVAGYPYPTLETYGLGDTVTVIDERLNALSIVSRVTEYQRFPYESLNLSTVQIQSLIDTTYDQMKSAHSNITGLLKTVNISPRRNSRPIGTVGNPAGPAVPISKVINTDGSTSITIAWSFTEDTTSPIDGFGILVHQGTTNAAYTFPSTVTADANHLVNKTVRGYTIFGAPADSFYTIAVYPYRLVDQDIDASGQLKGGLWYPASSYQPSATVSFGGDVSGTVSGVPGGQISKTPVTFVIADGATSHNVNRADYVVPANATNADVTINQAINALPSSGGRVVLLDGTFQISNSINLKSNVSIEGQGKATVIKAAASVLNMIYANAVNDVAVKSMLIEGNAHNGSVGIKLSSVTTAIVDAVVTQNCGAQGIYATSVSGINITNSISQTNAGDGIVVENASNCMVSNCQTLNNVGNGIFLGVSAGGQCIGNTISGNTSNGNQGDGIYVDSISNNYNVVSNAITGNSVHGGWYGISLAYDKHNTVSGNSISNSKHVGLLVYYSDSDNVTGNTIQNSGDVGLEISGAVNNVVSQNTVTGSNQNNSTNDNIGIFNWSLHNNVQGNVCRIGSLTYQPRYGINVSDTTCTGNVVTNNDLYQSGATANLNDAGTGTVTTAGNRVA